MTAQLSDFRILIAPGLQNSGPGHWQTRWQELYPSFERVEQWDWERPELPAWSTEIGHTLRRSARPAVIVAHSFGCLATVHCAARGAPNLFGALLVAPASPYKFGVARELARAKLDIPALVIGSEDDPWMSAQEARQWAEKWNADFFNAGALGHINAESNVGDWLPGLAHLQRLVRTIGPRRTCRCKSAVGNEIGFE